MTVWKRRADPIEVVNGIFAGLTEEASHSITEEVFSPGDYVEIPQSTFGAETVADSEVEVVFCPREGLR